MIDMNNSLDKKILNNDIIYSWWLTAPHNEEPWCWAKLFNKDQCESIIELANKYVHLEKGKVGGHGFSDKSVNETKRKSKVGWIPVLDDTRWIFENLTDAVNTINKQFYDYDLKTIESLQFSIYSNDNEFYAKHIDMMYNTQTTRKLSFSVQLSDPDSYTGGDLNIYQSDEPSTAKREQGVINLFPSWTLHEVTPVTKGIRYSLVGWVLGPRFK